MDIFLKTHCVTRDLRATDAIQVSRERGLAWNPVIHVSLHSFLPQGLSTLPLPGMFFPWFFVHPLLILYKHKNEFFWKGKSVRELKGRKGDRLVRDLDQKIENDQELSSLCLLCLSKAAWCLSLSLQTGFPCSMGIWMNPAQSLQCFPRQTSYRNWITSWFWILGKRKFDFDACW